MYRDGKTKIIYTSFLNFTQLTMRKCLNIRRLLLWYANQPLDGVRIFTYDSRQL